MKIICLLLSIVVAVLSGILVFTSQAGHLPMRQPAPLVVESSEEEPEQFNPIIGTQVGLVDELVESLQMAHEELSASKLRLDKREDNLQELYASYLKLRQETAALITDLETRLVRVDEEQMKNFKKLSSVYSSMDPGSAAQSLKHMDTERVALILSQMDSRGLAAIMDSAVTSGPDGSEFVAQWSDAIRRLNDGESE